LKAIRSDTASPDNLEPAIPECADEEYVGQKKNCRTLSTRSPASSTLPAAPISATSRLGYTRRRRILKLEAKAPSMALKARRKTVPVTPRNCAVEAEQEVIDEGEDDDGQVDTRLSPDLETTEVCEEVSSGGVVRFRCRDLRHGTPGPPNGGLTTARRHAGAARYGKSRALWLRRVLRYL
jgi:hypothetical protein